MTRRLVAVIAFAALGITPVFATEPDDERIVREAGMGIEGPALLTFFRTRTVNGVDSAAIEVLIARLGDDDFSVREKATDELVSLGGRAEKFLQDALKSRDAEIRRRAESCLKRITNAEGASVVAAAVRLLATRKPEGTAETLLNYLPFAPEESVVETIRSVLGTVAVTGGIPDPVLIKALTDRSTLKRGAAALALSSVADADTRAAVRKLLADGDAELRARLALALAGQKDKDAMPVLIASLSDAPLDLAYQVEEALSSLAGESAPRENLTKNDDDRRKSRDAWAAWWKKNAETADLGKIVKGGAYLGRTLVAMTSATTGQGQVVEFGRDGKVRFQIEGLVQPRDVQGLAGDRVLITEYTQGRVTERNQKGEVLWEYKSTGTAVATRYILSAQRLANGNTFMVQRQQLLEVDKDGKEVSSTKVGTTVYAARKAKNGETVYITLAGKCVRLDAAGKEISSFNITRIGICGIDILPNGNVLLPVPAQNKVMEYDDKGKVVWEADVTSPISASRMPNGNVLVASSNGACVVELNREGKEVRKLTLEGHPLRAFGR
jgi:hypothetical protein